MTADPTTFKLISEAKLSQASVILCNLDQSFVDFIIVES